MRKNKIYTVKGIQGIKISRTQGFSMLTDGLDVNWEDEDAVNEQVFDSISEMGTDNFIAEGMDVLVEADLDNGQIVNAEIIDSGTEGYFEDDDNEDDEETYPDADDNQ